MAQLSRPYQIALGAVALLALVWAVALRGHSSSPSEPAPSSTSSAPATSRSPGAPSKIYHGPAPGVEGLTRDIAKAHGAVATSESNARQLGRASAQASGEAASPASAQKAADASAAARQSVPTHNPASSRAHAQSHSHVSAHRQASERRQASEHSHVSAKHAQGHGKGRSGSGGASTNGRAPEQLEVEHELAHGKTALLLFWDPRSSVDNVVRSQVLSLGKSSKGKLAVHTALADQVGLFGKVTEVAHVYQTPTILIVGRHGLITTLTGLLDKFSLEQAVREAEQANR